MTPADLTAAKRMFAALRVGLVIMTFGTLPVLVVMPSVWARTQWSAKQAHAENIRDYDVVEPGSSYESVEAELGEPTSIQPGFRTGGHINAGIFCWRCEDGEVRGLVVNDRLEGHLKVGDW